MIQQNQHNTYHEALSKEFETFYKCISDKTKKGENWQKMHIQKNSITKKSWKRKPRHWKVKKILLKYGIQK